jgi:diguanylate cyclase (GGDEF)-like protein/PAS domain S-box-containing protein
MAEIDDLRNRIQIMEAKQAKLQHQVTRLQRENQALRQAQRPQSGSTDWSGTPLGEARSFQTFMDHAPLLAWITDGEGVFRYSNNPCLQTALPGATTLVGKSLEEIFPPALAELCRRNNQQMDGQRPMAEAVEMGESGDGEKRFFWVRTFPIGGTRGTEGQADEAWVGGIGIDMTELKRMEAALRDSEVRWQFAIAGSGDGLWDWNAQTNEVFFSHQWKAMLGYTDHEVANSLTDWDDRVHPEDKAQCYADLERHFKGETPFYQNEHRVRCKDGSYKWILDRGKVMAWQPDGQPLRVIGTHTDISDRKRAELYQQQVEITLRQSEATNRAILRAIPDLLLRVGRDGQCFTSHAPNPERANPFSPIPRHLSEVLPLDLLETHLWHIDQALTTGELQVWEQERVKQGQTCHEEVRLVPCSDDACLAIVRDITERKRMELALEAKINELDRFFSVSLDLLCIADTNGYFRRLNCAWETTLGYSITTLEDSLFISYVHPDDMAATRHALADLREQTAIVGFTNRYRCQGGNYVWLEWRAVVVDHLVYAAARDITDRRQAEIGLERTKEQLAMVLQASSEGYWDWDLLTEEIYFSPRWKAMLGYHDEELNNTLATWKDLIFPDDRAAVLQILDDCNSGRIDHFSMTQRLRHKNGTILYILVRAIHQRNATGQVVRLVGSHLDVTPMVTMQEALRTSQMQLSSVLNSSLDGIMAFRAVRQGGKIVDFAWLLSNPAACELVGHTADYLIDKTWLTEMPGDTTGRLFNDYVQVVETGEPVQGQFHYTHKGLDTWFENIAVKLGDGFAVTLRNITPLKQSEQALQEANQTLENRLSELRHRNEEMRLLGKMNDFLQACLTLEEAYRALGTLVAALFPTSSGGIFVLNSTRDRMENVVTWGKSLTSIAEFSPQDCWGLRQGRSHQVGPDCPGLRCTHALTTTAHTLCLPLLAQSEIFGLFYLNIGALPFPLQQLARTVAEQLALALANLHLRETLRHQSIRDPLTGLYNRRYLEETLAQEIQRAQRHQHPIGVIMLDIDNFKRFNDTYGHDAGDRVLQAVGQILRNSVRGSDIACRYGGEEMTLVLPESPLAATQARAEDLRLAIARLQLHYEGVNLDTLAVSLGVACYPEHGRVGKAVLKMADAALYQAKAQGRNCVVVAPHRAAGISTVPGATMPSELGTPSPPF